MDKSPDAFRTISEAAEELDVPQHVLRFWETRFNQLKPMKRGGGRRYYRPDDMELLKAIRHLQVPDRVKRARADFIIETGRPKSETHRQIRFITSCFHAR